MGLSAAQLCTRAAGMAGVTGFTTQAGDYLNAALASLARNWDFDILRKTAVINVGAGPTAAGNNILAAYSLPADYLRGRNQYFTISGFNYVLKEIPLADFDALPPAQGQNNNPYWWATDINPAVNLVYLYPVPNLAFTLNFRYQSLPADIVGPPSSGVTPWFPDTRYLLYQVAADLMGYTGDQRQGEYLKIAEDELNKYMKMYNDDEGYARTLQFDSRYFATGNTQFSPTKSQPL